MRADTVISVMSRSSNKTWPLSGWRWAVIRLTSVVLPAPFEPTSDRNSPFSTVKLTPSQALSTPNRLRSSTVRNRLILRSLHGHQPLGDLRQSADDAGRKQQYQRHQHGAEQQLPVLGRGHGVGLDEGEGDAADDRAKEIAEAAEQGHKHDFAGKRPVQNIRRRQPVERRPQDAGKPGEGA